jgi:hypothetical protein
MAFSCTTMYSGASLLRNAIYGSDSALVGQSTGILIMWIVVDFGLFVGVSLWKGAQAAKAKAAAAAAAKAKAAEGGAAATAAAEPPLKPLDTPAAEAQPLAVASPTSSAEPTSPSGAAAV